VVGSPRAIRSSTPAVWARMRAQGAAFCDFFGTHAGILASLREGGMSDIITLEGLDVPRLFAPPAIDLRKTVNVAVIPSAAHCGSWLHDPSRWHVTKSDANQDRYNPR